MSERIDHAARARIEYDATNDVLGDEGITDGTIVASAILVQVHATLALVEQQRIANLIALWSVNDTSFCAAAFDALGSVPADWGGKAELYPHIKEALGIG